MLAWSIWLHPLLYCAASRGRIRIFDIFGGYGYFLADWDTVTDTVGYEYHGGYKNKCPPVSRCWPISAYPPLLFSCVSLKVIVCHADWCESREWSVGHAEQLVFSCLCAKLAVYRWKWQWFFLLVFISCRGMGAVTDSLSFSLIRHENKSCSACAEDRFQSFTVFINIQTAPS